MTVCYEITGNGWTDKIASGTLKKKVNWKTRVTAHSIDPNVIALLREMQQQGTPPVQSMEPVEARETRNPTLERLNGPPDWVAKVDNLNISGPGGDLPIRIYTPG